MLICILLGTLRCLALHFACSLLGCASGRRDEVSCLSESGWRRGSCFAALLVFLAHELRLKLHSHDKLDKQAQIS